MPDTTRKDIGYVVDNRLCLSCGACAAACSKKSITFNETSGGYLYPKIDYLSCVHCGLCLEVCPGARYIEEVHNTYLTGPHSESILDVYVGRSLDDHIYRNAQSGGIVTGLLKDLLQRNAVDAVLCAEMAHVSPPRGEAVLVRIPHELNRAQKSKYAPIPLLEHLREYLKCHSKIAVVGLPCHMQGLEHLMKVIPEIEDKIVLRIGLICDRILTAKSIDWLSKQGTDSPVSQIIYKDKTRSGYPGDPSVETTDGKIIMLKASDRMEIKDFFTPVRCRLCLDKMNACADIVCGDPHGMNGIDRKNGETLVLVRTERGKQVLAVVADTVALRKVSIGEAVSGQHIDERIRDWKMYLRAWKGLGMPQPIGADDQIAGKKALKTYKRNIKQGLDLDAYESVGSICNAADEWLKKKRMKSRLLSALKTIKKVLIKF